MKHFSNLMQRFLLVMLALCASVSVDAYDFEAAHFSKSWPFVNECSLQQEEESGYCGNPDVNEGKNLCYVVTSVNDVKTLTISRNPHGLFPFSSLRMVSPPSGRMLLFFVTN